MKKTVKVVLPILLGVLIAVVLLGSLVTTRPNEYTIVKQFGKVVRVIDQPGLSLKTPFVQSVSTLPKTEMLYDLAASDVITSDKKSMVADSFVLWRITDPLKFIQTLSGSVANAEARLDQAVYNSLKTVISSMKQEDVISGRDGELAARITEHVNDTTEFSGYGIEVLAIETKRIDLPDENKAAVYERMISERGNIAASYEAQGNAEAKRIRNEADKTVEITISEANSQSEKLKAEGEAEYMRILSEVYDTPEEADFYEFMRALDMAQKALVSGEKTLVVSSDSPIAQIFAGQWEYGHGLLFAGRAVLLRSFRHLGRTEAGLLSGRPRIPDLGPDAPCPRHAGPALRHSPPCSLLHPELLRAGAGGADAGIAAQFRLLLPQLLGRGAWLGGRGKFHGRGLYDHAGRTRGRAH